MGLFSKHAHKHPTEVDVSEDDEETQQAKQQLPSESAGASTALKKAVAHAGQPGAAPSGAGILGFADHVHKQGKEASWIKKFIPELEQKTAQEEYGNFVVINRQTGEQQFESVPIYVRVGMSLLYTGVGDDLLGYKYIQNLLLKQSVKQGKTFDQEVGAYEHIESFVKTYQLENSLDQLLEPDLEKYKTFNEFFYRRLKPDARPSASPEDPSVVVSSADCRLTVWEDVDTAKEIWVKGRKFTIPSLLSDESISSHPGFANGCSLAIFRLAPQDYHRWHSPMAGIVGPTKNIPGSLYTVNPMAVRNPDVNVFTSNKRDIQLLSVPALQQGESPIPIPVISVGAMLVGSIGYTKKQGDQVAKGEELGYFAYGGSTVIVLFPKGFIHFDEDLVKSSKSGLETVVKVGERIGARVQ